MTQMDRLLIIEIEFKITYRTYIYIYFIMNIYKKQRTFNLRIQLISLLKVY